LLLRQSAERAPTSRGLQNATTSRGLQNAPINRGFRSAELVRRVSSTYLHAGLRRLAADYALVLLPILLIAGWWYVRNWQLYGDPTGLSAMLAIVGRRPGRPSLFDLLGEFEGLRINFWGLFGVVNVLLRPTWIYRVFDALTIIAMIGAPVWVWRYWRRGRPVPWREIGLLSAWILVEFGALIRWTSETYASQGRLLFPALAPICLFLASGVLGWLPARWQGRGVTGLVAIFFALSVTAPFTSILPAYARPALLTTAEIPASARPFDVTYGDIARLVAFEVGKDTVQPGEALPVTLYWQALKPTTEDLSIFVQLVAGQDTILGQTDSYPGGGAYPTSMWSPGEIIRDEFMVPVQRGTTVPEAVRLLAGIYRYKTLNRLPAVDNRGQAVTQPVLTRVKVSAPPRAQFPPHPLDANLADRVRLIGYDLPAEPARPGTDVLLTLYWQALNKVGGDYMVFIHLLDENDARVAQGDGPPLDNAYPTSFWAAGESLADTHRLKIPANIAPGRYRIAVGLYDPISGQRLAVLEPQATPPADRIIVAALDVAPP
ncbi:MAG: 2 protein, partial [Chloroflexota bacterium]|nr:2 protein [Chloroflexota bacterium]